MLPVKFDFSVGRYTFSMSRFNYSSMSPPRTKSKGVFSSLGSSAVTLISEVTLVVARVESEATCSISKQLT